MRLITCRRSDALAASCHDCVCCPLGGLRGCGGTRDGAAQLQVRLHRSGCHRTDCVTCHVDIGHRAQAADIDANAVPLATWWADRCGLVLPRAPLKNAKSSVFAVLRRCWRRNLEHPVRRWVSGEGRGPVWLAQTEWSVARHPRLLRDLPFPRVLSARFKGPRPSKASFKSFPLKAGLLLIRLPGAAMLRLGPACWFQG